MVKGGEKLSTALQPTGAVQKPWLHWRTEEPGLPASVPGLAWGYGHAGPADAPSASSRKIRPFLTPKTA